MVASLVALIVKESGPYPFGADLHLGRRVFCKASPPAKAGLEALPPPKWYNLRLGGSRFKNESLPPLSNLGIGPDLLSERRAGQRELRTG